MTNLNDLFPKPHMTAYDLDGKSYVLTIEQIFKKKLWDNKLMTKVLKPCIRFKNTEKYFILGEKNGQQIAKVLGSRDIEDWIGQRICLYSYKTTHSQSGEAIEVIRISDKLPDPKPPTPVKSSPV